MPLSAQEAVAMLNSGETVVNLSRKGLTDETVVDVAKALETNDTVTNLQLNGAPSHPL